LAVSNHIDVKTGEKFTVLKTAMRSIAVRLLTAAALSCATPHADQEEALKEAVFKGDAKQIKELLAKGADVNAKDNQGMTALMWAAKYGWLHEDTSRLLLEKGADINARANDGSTALMWAARANCYTAPIIKILLENGAEMNAKDNLGRTALRWARTVGFPMTAEFLKAQGAKE
jgi:ankyrin repeat protein